MELLGLVLCVWLLWKIFGVLFKMTWGVTKGLFSLAIGIASVLIIACLLFAGGILILLPIAILGAVFGLMKRCL